MLGRNTIAKVSYNEGATPNARGNYGVKSVTRTGPGVFDVELVYGYSPDSDFASVEVTGSGPGFAQAEPVPGDAGRIRVRTWVSDAPPSPTDLPFSLRIERDTPLAGAQDLLQQQEPPPVPYFVTDDELEGFLLQRGRGNTLARPYANTQGFQASLNPGQKTTLLRSQALAEGRANPTLIALHVSATPLPNVDAVPSDSNSRPACEVRWGCGGGTHEAIFDVGQGTTIQLVADSIELSALYLPPPPGVVTVVARGAELLFRCTAVYGSRAAAQSSPTATFTDGPATLVPGDPPIVGLIPPFSKGLAVLLDDVTDLRSGAQVLQVEAAPNVTFLGGQSIQIGAAEYPSRYGVPFMLAPDARFVRVGVAGGRAVAARLVYDLCL